MASDQAVSGAQSGNFGRAPVADPGRIAAAAAVYLPPAIFVVAILSLWAVLSATGHIPSFILPSPGALADQYVSNTQVLAKHAWVTTLEAISGFLIGNVVAVLMAIAFSYSPVLRDSFYPYALASRAVPIVVLTPLVVIMLGRGLPPIIAIVSLSVYFPTFLNMMRGLASADVEYQELLHTFSASASQRLRLIQLPASMPYLFAALKVSASHAFIAALVTEWIGSNAGLGYLVLSSSQYFRLPTMWAAIFLTAVLTLVLLGLVVVVERLLARWTAVPADL